MEWDDKKRLVRKEQNRRSSLYALYSHYMTKKLQNRTSVPNSQNKNIIFWKDQGEFPQSHILTKTLTPLNQLKGSHSPHGIVFHYRIH